MNPTFRCVCLLAVAVNCNSAASADAPPPASGADLKTALSSPDPASDLVASFYTALLQEEPPTLEQENALFRGSSVIRRRLVLGEGDPRDAQAVEPVHRTQEDRARRRLEDQTVAAAGPVVLAYFREHKQWFLPVPAKTRIEVSISSLGRFVRTLEQTKEPPKAGNGFVLAVVHDTKDGRTVVRTRTIVFQIADGLIDPDGICLDGFGGNLTREEALKQ